MRAAITYEPHYRSLVAELLQVPPEAPWGFRRVVAERLRNLALTLRSAHKTFLWSRADTGQEHLGHTVLHFGLLAHNRL